MVNKYLKLNDLYSKWAKVYDKENNLIMFLEEQITKGLFNFSGKEILDLGCGTGRYSIPLAKKNRVTAVDMNSSMLEIARKKARKSGVKIDFQLDDVTKFRPRKKYDVILSMLVQDHVKNLDSAAKVIFNSSKIGSLLFVSNVSPQVVKEKTPIFQNYWTDEFYHSLSEYKKIFKRYGFELIEKRDIIFKEDYLKFIELENASILKNKKLGILYIFKRLK